MEEWTTTRCIHEEMTQVMAINIDLKGSDLTLFHDDLASKRTELMGSDKFVLKVLYDPRIAPGMEGDELKETVTRIVDEKDTDKAKAFFKQACDANFAMGCRNYARMK